LKATNFTPDFFNNATELMTESEGRCFPGDAVRGAGLGNEIVATEILVDVCTADSAELRCNADGV